MKILYTVQATGNGHISRAMELLPYLQKYGAVDVFLSGDNSHLPIDAPVKYRSKGISLFYNCNGGLDYWKIWKDFKPFQIRKEIKDLPVEKYDLVLNDFDYITSAACARKKIPSIHFGHQASFQSPLTPRPAIKNLMGELLLKNFVKANYHIGYHFDRFDKFIFPPIVKKNILEAEPEDKGHITVYLPSFCELQLSKLLKPFTNTNFHIFSAETLIKRRAGHLHFFPIQKNEFSKSMISCTGIITGGGFETPSEALHLGKKIISIPIRGQYEQQCNAAALEKLGATCIAKPGADFTSVFENWLNNVSPVQKNYSGIAEESIKYVLSLDRKKLISDIAA